MVRGRQNHRLACRGHGRESKAESGEEEGGCRAAGAAKLQGAAKPVCPVQLPAGHTVAWACCYEVLCNISSAFGFWGYLGKLRGWWLWGAAACLLGKPLTWRRRLPVRQAASSCLLRSGSYQHGLDSELGAERLMGVCCGGGSAQPSEVRRCAGPLGCQPWSRRLKWQTQSSSRCRWRGSQ